MLNLAKIAIPNNLTPEQREVFEALSAHVTTLTAHAAELEDYARRQENLVRELQRLLRGKKSEKLTPDERQLAFEDLEIAISDTEEEGQERGVAPTTRKQAAPSNRNIGNLPADLPRIEQVVEPDSLECPCGCGQMHKIGEDRSERLDIIPAQLRVIVTIRPKYGCRSCSNGVTQASAPAYLIAGALPTEGTLAHVLVGKYADHCPLYRQSQILARSGIDIERSTLANWVGKAAFHLTPVFEHLAEQLKTSTKLFMDETTAPVLDPGRGRTKTGYLWALARDDRAWQGGDPPGVVYYYAPGRNGEYAQTFLEGFNGILQIDGYAGYNRLAKSSRKGGEPVRFAYCWAHCRRKLREIFDRDGSTIAAEGLRRIAEFYAIEAEIRGSTAEERLNARQKRTAPLIADFKIWLDQGCAKVSAKSRLGEKLGYIARHWEGLQTFLDDGRVEIDSNLVENQIRPLALNRKNALFAGHDTGAKAWGIIASLIATAKLNNVEPFAYLKETLEAIAQGHPQNRIDELLPWNWVQSKQDC
jgi:transposase